METYKQKNKRKNRKGITLECLSKSAQEEFELFKFKIKTQQHNKKRHNLNNKSCCDTSDSYSFTSKNICWA